MPWKGRGKFSGLGGGNWPETWKKVPLSLLLLTHFEIVVPPCEQPLVSVGPPVWKDNCWSDLIVHAAKGAVANITLSLTAFVVAVSTVI